MAETGSAKTQRINKALYERMKTAQDVYRAWLLEQPPEEILNHAYEYVVREDILLSMEYRDLSYPRAKALLQTPDPVSGIFKDFQKIETGYMETIGEVIENRADVEMQKRMEARSSRER